MTPDEFTACLSEHGILYERTRDAVSVGGDHVDLPGLPALPAGVAFNNGGSVYLGSLTALPEGAAFNNGGSVYLPSLTALPEGAAFNNGGSVHLPSLTEEVQRYQGRDIRLRTVDWYTMLILSERTVGDVTVCHARYFGGGDIDNLKSCWIATVGEYNAHGETIAGAIADARFKAMEHDFDRDDLIATIKARGTVTFWDFRLLTGACEAGLRHGMAQAGLDPSATELPLDTVLAAAFGSYGDAFRKGFEG